MAWLEDVIAWASPKTAYEREAWRQGLESLRGYDAGDGNRLNSGWRVANRPGKPRYHPGQNKGPGTEFRHYEFRNQRI